MSGTSEQKLPDNTDFTALTRSDGTTEKGGFARFSIEDFYIFVKSTDLVQKPSDLDINKPIYFSGSYHFKFWQQGSSPSDSFNMKSMNFINIYDFNHNPIDYTLSASNNNNYYEGTFSFKSAYTNWSDVTTYESGGYRIKLPFYISFDLYTWFSRTNPQNTNKFYFTIDTTTTTAVNIVYNNKESTNYYVSDSGTQQELEDLNTTQESIKDTTEDTNETTHSIFDSISDFFGSFFNNLIGVFVPEDGFFTTWFNNLNTLLTQKLGILYYPFSVFIDICNRLVTAVAGNQPTDAVIYFPELKIKIQNINYTIIEQQEVHLANYAVNIQNADTSNSPMFGLNNLIHVIRRFTDIILTLLMFKLLRQKLNLIIKGEDYDN